MATQVKNQQADRRSGIIGAKGLQEVKKDRRIIPQPFPQTSLSNHQIAGCSQESVIPTHFKKLRELAQEYLTVTSIKVIQLCTSFYDAAQTTELFECLSGMALATGRT